MFWKLFFEASAVIGLILAVSWAFHALFIKRRADEGNAREGRHG